MISKIVKSILPPIVLDIYRKLQNTGRDNSVFYGIEGDYVTWNDAKKEVKSRGYGYDAPEIVEQVRNAIHEVRNGNAVFERDRKGRPDLFPPHGRERALDRRQDEQILPIFSVQ